MNFSESVAYLYSLGNEVSAMKLGLENIRKLLAALGDPQKNYIKIQVAGTNGKGSVCAFVDSICLQAGIAVGVFTSPHLVSITERVRISGVDISDEEFARIATLVQATAENLVDQGELETVPTYFEQATAIALVAFAEARVELAILETGLGGRLDATTAANAEVVAITRIDLDHQEYLGDTIEQIAAEKAAIIRSDSLACIGRQVPAADHVISKWCKQVGAVPKTLDRSTWSWNSGYADFVLENFRYDEVEISLPGEHQFENAALAILISLEIRKFFQIDDEAICKGLRTAVHPGRLEWLQYKDVRILLDGAHNPSGIEALANYLRRCHPDAQIAGVFGSMIGKDYSYGIQKLLPLVKDMISTEPDNFRSVSASRIANSAIPAFRKGRVLVVPDVSQALDTAVQLAKTYPCTREAFVLVTGSLFLVGDAKRIVESQI